MNEGNEGDEGNEVKAKEVKCQLPKKGCLCHHNKGERGLQCHVTDWWCSVLTSTTEEDLTKITVQDSRFNRVTRLEKDGAGAGG